MEVHLVHFNTEYGMTLADAIAEGRGNYDTLAVLGFMFEISPNDNKGLEPIIEGFEIQNFSLVFLSKFVLQPCQW